MSQSSPILIGREAELDAFDGALERAQQGSAAVLLIGADAGMGKSRLVEECAARTQRAGGHSIIVSCPPVGSDEPVPWAAVATLVRTIARSVEGREFDALVGPGRGVLSTLMPELGPRERSGAEPDPFAQVRLLEVLLATVGRVAAWRPPLTLVIEDMQWADSCTRAFLTTLVMSTARRPAVLISTYRPDALRPGHPLQPLIEEFHRHAQVERLELEPLSESHVEKLLSLLLAAPPERDIVRSVYRRSGGNPYFVEGLADALREGKQERLSMSIAASTRAELLALDGDERAVLEAAALAGYATEARTLAFVTGLAKPVVRAALQAATQRRLLVATEPAGDGAVRFRHELQREAVDAGLTSAERQALHARYALSLEGAGAPELGGPLERSTRRAAHLSAAQDPRAGMALVEAARESEEVYAFGAARDLYRRALDTGSLPADVAHGATERAAECASLSGHPAEAVALVRKLVDQPGATERTHAGLLQLRLGRYLWEGGDHSGSLAAYRAAVSLTCQEGHTPTSARALASLANAQMLAGSYGDAMKTSKLAIDVARATGAGDQEIRALTTLGVVLSLSGAGELGRARLADARRLAEIHAKGDPGPVRPSRIPDVLRPYLDRAAVTSRSGDLAAAAAIALAGGELARGSGVDQTWGGVFDGRAAVDLFGSGHWQEVDRLTAPAVEGQRAPELHLARAMLETARGDLRAAAAQSDACRMLAGPRGREAHLGGRWEAVAAEIAIRQGQLTQARSVVSEGLERLHGIEDRAAVLELAMLGLRIEADAATGARARRASAELARAHELAATLSALVGEPAAETPAETADGDHESQIVPPRWNALAMTARAEVARLRQADEEQSWSQVAESWQRVGEPYRVGYAHWRHAEALLAKSGSRTEAANSLAIADGLARSLGAALLGHDVHALARRARIRLETAPENRRTAQATADPRAAAAKRLGMSAREMDVLPLLAAGLTNKSIAERLFVSEKTVEFHVSSILGKLAASRRGEAVAVAFRAGLLGEDWPHAHPMAGSGLEQA